MQVPASPLPIPLFRGPVAFGWAALGHGDQGRPQQPVMHDPAGLHHLDHRAGWLAGIGNLEHGLMEVGVEPLARRRFHLADGIPLKGREQLALG